MRLAKHELVGTYVALRIQWQLESLRKVLFGLRQLNMQNLLAFLFRATFRHGQSNFLEPLHHKHLVAKLDTMRTAVADIDLKPPTRSIVKAKALEVTH